MPIALFLLSGAAGAPFLPKLVATARGDVASAVALMALLTVGTILFMPFALPLIIPGMQANAWSIAQPLLLLILLPLIIGMVIKNRAAGFAARLAPGLTRIANASLVLLFLLLLGFNFSALLGVVGSGAILAAILYVVGLFAVAWIWPGRTEGERSSGAGYLRAKLRRGARSCSQLVSTIQRSPLP